MGNYTGKWRTRGLPSYEKCECGNEKGIEVTTLEFDAESLDAMKNDGETKEERRIICPVCSAKANH